MKPIFAKPTDFPLSLRSADQAARGLKLVCIGLVLILVFGGWVWFVPWLSLSLKKIGILITMIGKIKCLSAARAAGCQQLILITAVIDLIGLTGAVIDLIGLTGIAFLGFNGSGLLATIGILVFLLFLLKLGRLIGDNSLANKTKFLVGLVWIALVPMAATALIWSVPNLAAIVGGFYYFGMIVNLIFTVLLISLLVRFGTVLMDA
ncbi:hypothetical protein OAF34_01860 [Pirellulaceae bacterium]|nr:hypothetical protein [Pirellulaceae bacterium]